MTAELILTAATLAGLAGYAVSDALAAYRRRRAARAAARLATVPDIRRRHAA